MMKLIDRYIGDALLRFFALWKKSTKPLPRPIKKILIIKLIAMGDLIVITPLVRTLKQAYPDAQIDLVAATRVKPIVENTTLYNHVYYLSFGFDFLWSFIRNVSLFRKENYDLILDLEFYYRLTTLLARLSRPQYLLGFDLQTTRTKVFDSAIAYDPDVHVSDAYLNLATSLQIKHLDRTLEPLTINKRDQDIADHIVTDPEFIMVHIGTSARAISRRWDSTNWAKLFAVMTETTQVVLIGGSEEADLVKNISLPHRNLLNLINQLNIPQTAALMKRAKLYIGLDTGPTHLAAAMGVPIVAMYGPNTPLRWGPYTQNASIIYKPSACSPCTRQYEGVVSSCKDNHCMTGIRVEEVLVEVRKYL
jgi:ADP-heptose:LPS heptosyltransferase